MPLTGPDMLSWFEVPRPLTAAEPLLDYVSDTVAGHDRGDRFVERCRDIPGKGDRTESGAADAGDGSRLHGLTVRFDPAEKANGSRSRLSMRIGDLRSARTPHQGRRASTVGPRTPFHRSRDRARYR